MTLRTMRIIRVLYSSAAFAFIVAYAVAATPRTDVNVEKRRTQHDATT